ncbi:MAG: VTT domain-containing protein [Candidatus Hodarchaeota archaeon]
MNKKIHPHSKVHQKKKLFFSKKKSILIALEVFFVAVLFVLWFGSESLRESRSLWILFIYAFPANFIAAVVPYDPAVIYFGKFYSPLYVTLMGVSSMTLVEGINYSVLSSIANTKMLLKIGHNKFINRIITLFKKAPFVALCVAGFLPIPFYPFRFLVVLSRYPFTKFVLAVLAAKLPRIYILALLGYLIDIPDYLIMLFFILLVMLMYVSFFINQLKARRK